MGEVKFTLQDVEDLTRKVSTLAPDLTANEHALLLAIFAAAADRIEVSATGQGTLPAAAVQGEQLGAEQLTVADFRRQLLNAYIPGEGPTEGGFRALITAMPPGPPFTPPPRPPRRQPKPRPKPGGESNQPDEP